MGVTSDPSGTPAEWAWKRMLVRLMSVGTPTAAGITSGVDDLIDAVADAGVTMLAASPPVELLTSCRPVPAPWQIAQPDRYQMIPNRSSSFVSSANDSYS